MQEFDDLIRYCVQKFNSTPFCSHCEMSQCRRCFTNNCYNCLAHIHSIHTKEEHYSCEKITYNYILKYGYRYVSEMAWAFFRIRRIINSGHPLNIISVGSGPSTELYAIAAVYRNMPFTYSGFDQNSMWLSIQQFNVEKFNNQLRNINYYYRDFIEYVKDHNVYCDILVFNYFFSDFVKYQPQDCESFIENLINLIHEGRFSTIIINDVMLLYNYGTGYACMEKIARNLKSNQYYSFIYERRHFAEPNQFQFEYGIKLKDFIGFKPIIQEALPFEPFETCGSIQLIIKTLKK